MFLVPAILLTLVFAYLPMFSNVIAFMDYDPGNGWFGLKSPFVGLKYFSMILQDQQGFYPLVWRTFYYSVLGLVFGFPIPIILALLINELKARAFKRTVQTIFYLPHFVSWVTIASLVYWFLTTDTEGVFNNIRQFLGAEERIIYMKYPKYFPWVLVISGNLKGAGWGTIIFLAAIAAIDPQLYEAATIDGAGRWKQFVHVTFPGILPTTVMMLIFAFGGLFSSNFDQVYNLQNPIIRTGTDTINVYTYWTGVFGGKYSIATAVGLFQGAINAALILAVNWVAKKVTDYGFF
jgi:putative aldouronate transport system permease protein